ncbi:spore coat protein U domain-containing protein [Bdellovibrionota bacterium FG-2]
MRLVLLVLGLLSVSLGANECFAATCDPVISASNVVLTWNSSFSSQAVTFLVTNHSKKGCQYYLGFSDGGASSYLTRRLVSGANTIGYQLYGDAGLGSVLKTPPDTLVSSEVLVGEFFNTPNSGVVQTFTYYLSVPQAGVSAPTWKRSGTYTDTFRIRLYKGAFSPGSHSSTDSHNVTISMVLPKVIQLSMVPTGGAFDAGATALSMNFGTLVNGAVASFDFRVSTNAGYAVSVSSANGGVMKHQNPAVSTTVPYQFSVSGTPVTLAAGSPVTVLTGGGQTAPSGVVAPVAVTVLAVDNRLAGAYSDVIQVSVATTE